MILIVKQINISITFPVLVAREVKFPFSKRPAHGVVLSTPYSTLEF